MKKSFSYVFSINDWKFRGLLLTSFRRAGRKYTITVQGSIGLGERFAVSREKILFFWKIDFSDTYENFYGQLSKIYQVNNRIVKTEFHMFREKVLMIIIFWLNFRFFKKNFGHWAEYFRSCDRKFLGRIVKAAFYPPRGRFCSKAFFL